MKLGILFIEDNPKDVDLILAALTKGGLETRIKVIEDFESISTEIKSDLYDVVICDYAINGFTAIEVIQEIKSINDDLPVIIVSDIVPDELAIEAVLAGAKDYILKNNFVRLAPAVKREYKAYHKNKEKKQTEDFLSALFNSPMGVRISDKARKIVSVNDRYCEMMGYTQEELIGNSLDMLIPEARVSKDTQSFNNFIKGLETSKPTIFRDYTKDGSYIDLLVTSKVVKTSNDKFLVDTFQDITEIEQYKRLFEEASKVAKLGGWQVDFVTGKETWTRQANNILNLNMSLESEISLKSLSTFLTKESKKELKDFLKQIKKGLPNEVELELKVMAGSKEPRWLKLSAQPIIEHGKVVQAFGALQNISEEKIKSIKLEKNENRYRFLFENSPNPKLIYEFENYTIKEVNKAACKLYGYTEEEFLQKTVVDIRPKEEREYFLKLTSQQPIDQNKVRVSNNVRHQKKNGDIIQVDVYSNSVMFDDELLNIVVINNKTETYKAEQKLTELNAVLNNLIDSSPLAIITLDKKGRVDEVWNKRAEELFGWKKHEVLGKVIPYVPKDLREEFNKNLDAAFSGVKSTVFEINRITEKGETLILKELTTPVEEKDGKVTRIMLLVEDITSQKKAEQALIESEVKYRQLVEASHDLVWRMDKSGEFTFVNSASKNILNYTPEELEGHCFINFVSEDQAKELKSKLNDLKKGKVFGQFDLKMKKKDGSFAYTTATIYPLLDADSVIIGSSGTATDITHIKEHQRQLEESLQEKEVLIKEIHHRVKNNLAVISGILGLQAMNLTDKATVAALEQSQSRIKSISMIHEQLYQKELFTSVEIKNYLNELISEVQSTLGEEENNISISVIGDEIDLSMNQAVPFGILANELITNALKFAFKGRKEGIILLELRGEGDKVFFSVSDDGIGLPSNFEKIKDRSLGMTLVETVVSQLNGRFTWGQLDGNGTKFCIEFNRVDMETWGNK
ncbi:MAG: PAS domain S-box protein [Balneolaceae bacterium]